jgi:hypothetical protein
MNKFEALDVAVMFVKKRNLIQKNRKFTKCMKISSYKSNSV